MAGKRHISDLFRIETQGQLWPRAAWGNIGPLACKFSRRSTGQSLKPIAFYWMAKTSNRLTRVRRFCRIRLIDAEIQIQVARFRDVGTAMKFWIFFASRKTRRKPLWVNGRRRLSRNVQFPVASTASKYCIESGLFSGTGVNFYREQLPRYQTMHVAPAQQDGLMIGVVLNDIHFQRNSGNGVQKALRARLGPSHGFWNCCQT